ncbi:MAG: YCF48-related protein [Aureispira sp.]
MSKQPLYYLLLLCLWTSCAQEELSYPIKEQQLPTDLTLTDAYFLDDQQGFVSAGNIFTNGLVFQTTNSGQTWTVLDSFNQGVHSLSLSYNGQDLLIGEAGQLLHQQSLPMNGKNTRRVDAGWWSWHSQISLANGNVLLVGGENFGRGFVHTYNSNTNTFTLTDTFNHELREIIQTPDGTIHAAGYGLVLRSTNEGQDWEVSRLQGDFFRGIDFPSDDVGYVVGEYGTVYKTTDGGINWTNCRAGNSLFANPDKLLRDIAFVDENTGFLVGTGSLVLRTTDGGKTWKKASNLDFKTDYQKIEIFDKVAYLMGHYGQLFRVNL